MDRNKFGQYFTPAHIANGMVRLALDEIPPSQKIRFLEPGFGYGAFYQALLQSIPESRLSKAWGYEINPEFVERAKQISPTGVLDLKLADFTTEHNPNERVNLLLCNPPYVRHHHLSSSNKKRLSERVRNVTGINLNGRAGLYCYFILLAHNWLEPEAISGWLLPSEFMDTEYGVPIREYLTTSVTLLRIHRFDPSESLFEDAIVSSTIVFFRNKTPLDDHKVNLSFGGTLSTPIATSHLKLYQMKRVRKWSNLVSDNNQSNHFFPGVGRPSQIRLSDFFEVKRGIATGANNFFIVPAEKIESLQLSPAFLTPILPSSRHLTGNEIKADENGEPVLTKKLFLIDCKLPEEELQQKHPRLWDYFETGIEVGIHLRTLCQNRTPWYSQELRPPAPIIFKYMGNRSKPSSRPLRFILNHSHATTTNAYHLLYPRQFLQTLVDSDPNLMRLIWERLNKIAIDIFLVEGRTYGGGKFKIEPGELENIPVSGLPDIL